MSEQKEWLQNYAKTIEDKVNEPINYAIGEYKGEYHKENGEFIHIQGKLFLTTHQGNLFKVYDKEKDIEDTFDVFSDESEIVINERLFPYVSVNNKIISIGQIDTDIRWLNAHFTQCGGAWENNDGDYGCISIAEDELALVKGISSRYPFEYEYDPSKFDKNPQDLGEDWSDMPFSVNDFTNNNVTKDNYIKVDGVAYDFKEELVGMLDKLKEELEWLPPRFREEFIELVCCCPQDRHSIRKNCEFFTDEIMDELIKEEYKQMFVRML